MQAAEANRNFSRVLREVTEGRSYLVTSHGRPVARIVPADAGAAVATDLIRRLEGADLVLPAQVLGELLTVLLRKGHWAGQAARQAVGEWAAGFETRPTSIATFIQATGLMVEHAIPVWDAVLLATAAEAGCRVLLSEDFHAGFTWGGVTVANPFADPPHPLLAVTLAGG